MGHGIRPWSDCLNALFALAICLTIIPTSAQAQKKKPKKPAPPKIRLPESVRKTPSHLMDVHSVDPQRRTELEYAASELDHLIEKDLAEHDQVPNQVASDEVFLRRVYLDVAGRIPTLDETTRFLDSTDPDKRVELIDELLSSPDWVSHSYNFWADTLRLVERPQPNIVAEPYLAYIKDVIRNNKPYDKWVYEMLTAEGKVWDNPAVGYQLRDDGMPLPYIDNTVRVFLGTQIGCAQCHDHPFDNWTQHQFYELAAFTAGTRTRIKKGDPGFEKTNPANALINQGRKHFDKGRVPGSFQRMLRANTYSVSEVKSELRLPHDYAYSDAKPKSVVKPAVLWGEVPSKAKQASRRHQFAAWLTSPDNEQFRHTIVNRFWKRFMGIGFVEPVDDFIEDTPRSNQAAMDFLGKQLVRSGFDLKDLTRIILYSRTYQRTATDYSLTSGELYHFPGPAIRRMSAEQVWDSMLTLAVRNPMPFQRPTVDEIKDAVDVDFASLTFDEAKTKADAFQKSYFLPTYKRGLNAHSYKGNILCRASELPSPQSAEHFLRQFGQGDRETIDGSDTEATVPQILAMFNGPITHVMLEPGSAIVDDVFAIEQARDRVDAIFMSVLSRRPTSRDRITAARELSKTANDAVGYGNIVWALLNTREFLFIR
ncbi:DUF1549 and DUF1553 domain-containing protein [Stieleria sp. JC731]|uniref:DUF1549 and DUF1553 domain-containing protein n=1 Tax=Pirellulaceae TaxID=2691357 RepID=UPI001E50BB93|nr:DUF1549 and DUF1553 domain-containing protein [Stieleria sp. JC731]MCC9603228.1 DUF1549 and DUF1553 domain-containing protein [Stieleria sp. JC731]